MPAPQIDDLQINAWQLYFKTNPVNKIVGVEDYFFQSIRNKQNKIADLFLEQIDPNIASPAKQTALHVACQHGNSEIAIKLIDKDVSLYATNHSGHSPIDLLLMQLEGSEQQKTLDYLLTNKKVLWGIKKNRAEYPIFHVLSTQFFSAMFSQMTDKKKNEMIMAEKVEENLLVQLARYHDTKGFLEVLEYAQEKNINLSTIVLEGKHSNLLIEISKDPNATFINGLIETKQFNVELCNDDGETPLFISLISGNLPVAQLLLDNGAKLFVKNFENKNPEDLISYFSRQDPSLHDKIKSFIESNKEKINLELAVKHDKKETKRKKTLL